MSVWLVELCVDKWLPWILSLKTHMYILYNQTVWIKMESRISSLLEYGHGFYENWLRSESVWILSITNSESFVSLLLIHAIYLWCLSSYQLFSTHVFQSFNSLLREYHYYQCFLLNICSYRTTFLLSSVPTHQCVITKAASETVNFPTM